MSRIPQSFIDDLLNRLDIVDVVDSRVKLKKTGKNYSACCPFHKEKTPSFTVSPDKQFYYCFGCGASGTAIGFVMEYDHLGFLDTVDSLAKTLGLEVPKEQSHFKPEQSHKNLYQLLTRANEYYQEQLKIHPQRQAATDYLKDRGLTGGIAKYFNMGFAPPGWDNIINKLGLNEEDNKLLEEGGLVIRNEESQRRYDRFRQRIIFPIIDVRGRTIGFGGRIIGSGQNNGRKEPKYLNSPETPVFYKGKELYGLYHAKQAQRQLERLLVVEGYMDVIALAQFGIRYAVATLGTACGEDHLKLCFRHTSEVVFCFDGDNAGRKAARRALENALPIMADGYQIKFLFLPEGQDPDSLVRQIGQERFEEQIQQAPPLEEFFFDALSENIDLRRMEGRARFSKIAAPLLHQLPSGVYKELMFDQLAKRTGLSTDLLMELVTPEEPKESSSEAGASKAETNEQQSTKQATRNQQDKSVGPGEYSASSASELSAPSYAPAELDDEFSPPDQYVNDDSYWSQAPAHNAERGLAIGSSQKPKPKQGRVRLNPAKLAITLLLEQPNLLSGQEAEAELLNIPEVDIHYLDDLKTLKQLLAYLKTRPQASFHGILGYWGGQYGLEAQGQLAELVADQFLGSAKRHPNYNEKLELHDALRRIHQEAKRQDHEKALKALLAKPQLTQDEKQKLKELLRAKAQSQLKPH